jgi:tRNA modification GTPase
LRLARPGEFTYRALINKKMNLLQVEGLDLVLNANSPFTLQHGNQLLKGAVFSSYIDFHQKFLHLRSAGERLLDFSEDIGELEGDIQFKNALFAFKEVIEGLYNRICNKSQALLNGEVVIYGPTNAGKSTFFNKILGIERAITSPIEGTTRDFIREDLNIKGNFFKIVDTAGLRALSDDPLEKIGMGMGRKVLEGAFFKILVLNPFLENWEGCLEEVSQQAESLDLLIFSHFDRDGFSEQKNMIQKRFSSLLRPIPSLNLSFVNDAFEINFMPGPIGPDKGMGEIFRANSFGSGPIGPVNGEIVDSLSFEMAGPIGPEAISFIKGMIFSKYEKEVSLDPIIIERHRQCLKKAYKMFESILRLQANGEDFGIIMHELTQLQGIIEELIGIIPAEQVLNNIFDNFCIGK